VSTLDEIGWSARLHQLLSTVHGARVTLIHEAFTSQVCSRCFLKMEGKQIGGKMALAVRRHTASSCVGLVIAQVDILCIGIAISMRRETWLP